MEEDPLLLKAQANGMDATAADRMEELNKKDGPSRARVKSIWLSVLHVWDLWALRHNLLSYP